MSIKTILPFVVTLAISVRLSAYAAEEPKPASDGTRSSARG